MEIKSRVLLQNLSQNSWTVADFLILSVLIRIIFVKALIPNMEKFIFIKISDVRATRQNTLQSALKKSQQLQQVMQIPIF